MLAKKLTTVIACCLLALIGCRCQLQDLENEGQSVAEIRRILSVSELKSARSVFCSNGHYIQSLPPWLNVTSVRIGQAFLRRNYPAFLYSVGLGSLLVAVSVDARRIAISGGNTTQPEKAMKRYLINILHFSYWAQADVVHDQKALFESFNLIHAVQAKVGHAAYAKRHMYAEPLIPEPERGQNPYGLDLKLWSAFHKDLLRSHLASKLGKRPVYPPLNGGTDVYFNQFAMALQLWAFAALPVLYPKDVLVHGKPTDEELLGYMQLWALVGYAMGMEDEHNICLQSNVQEARQYFQDILEHYFIPNLFHLDYETKVVLEVGCRAMGVIFPFVDLGVVLARMGQDVLHIDTPNVHAVMRPQARMYDGFLNMIGAPLMGSSSMAQSVARFVSNGLLQVPTLSQFGFNILNPRNFSAGILELDEDVLQRANVYYDEADKYKYCI